MPGLPLLPREIENPSCCCSYSRNTVQMCRQDSRVHLSPEEAAIAEESLSVYCKPVELYNILQRRALLNPYFLQRCLRFKMQAKYKKRIEMTISLSECVNGVQPVNILPLCIMLARPVPDVAAAGQRVVYRLSQAGIIAFPQEFGRKELTKANFILPEINKLSADITTGKLTILLVSSGENMHSSCERNLPKGHFDMKSFPSNFGGNCLWGKIPMESLHLSWEKHVNLNFGYRAEVPSTVEMSSCCLEASDFGEANCISFNSTPPNSRTMQVKVSIFAQEVEVKERSLINRCTYNNGPTSSHIPRRRAGNVKFNYKYYNNTLQKTEVTENFTCPFCLMRCASFKGLKCHLCACHDLFNFDFWVNEDYQAVNVSVKTDIWRSEIVADGVDPRLQTFFCCSKRRKRTRSKVVRNCEHVQPHFSKTNSHDMNAEGSCEGLLDKDAGSSFSPVPATFLMDAEPMNQVRGKKFENGLRSTKVRETASKAFLNEGSFQNGRHNAEGNGSENPCVAEFVEHVASSPNITGASTATAQSCAGHECVQPVAGSNLAPPAMLQFAKTRKLSIERSDPRNRILLQKRQFFHSHRAQPMALEQVLSDRDSEDEVDDDIADFEDRRMLDDFVDVTKHEKQIMHLWNSFVRKQRVLADGHVPWACEAFSRLHGRDLVRAPALIRCWRLFMIKLWNHSLLDPHAMNNCNIILEKYWNESLDPKLS